MLWNNEKAHRVLAAEYISSQSNPDMTSKIFINSFTEISFKE